MLKKVLLVIIAAILIGVGFGLYEWFRGKTDYTNSSVDISISADSLFNAFSKNEKLADSLYLGTPPKVILVKGVIKSVSDNQNQEKILVLKTSDAACGINCTMYKSDSAAVSKLKVGDKAKIKGLCTGYNGMEGLPGDVIITNGSIAK